MDQVTSTAPRMSDSPWFWVYLFGAAALIAMFLIGNKADTVQAQRDGNFTRRQLSLERQAADVAPGEQAVDTEAINDRPEPRYVDFTIFYGIIGAITVFAWVMHWRQFLNRRSPSLSQQASA